MAEITCTNCGKKRKVKPYILKKPSKYGRFCSPSCSSKYMAKFNPATQRKRVKTNCAYCGKELELQPYRLAERNFCNNSCAGKYGLKLRWPDGVKTTTVICSYCSHEKEIPVWEFEQRKKRGQDQFFCDRSCFGAWKSANWCGENNPSWKGGWTQHGTGWKAICAKVREDQKYKCPDCGASEDKLERVLDVHHIIPARFFKRKADASIRSNLVALCHPCHMKREYTEYPLFH